MTVYSIFVQVVLKVKGILLETPCIYEFCTTFKGTRWSSWVRHCDTRWKVAGSIPYGVRTHCCSWFDSVSNRNEYQEYFLGVKAAGAYGSKPYHNPVPIVMKSGNLIFVEPSGPVQARNGTALNLPNKEM